MEQMRVMYDEGAFPLGHAHDADAGYDIRTPIDVVVPHCQGHMNGILCDVGRVTVNTGVHVGIEKGYAGVVISKSGLNSNHGITATGLVDAEYNGEIRITLYNHTSNDYYFKRGDKLTQIMFVPVYTPELIEVDHFDDTDRGSNGFGSSGV
jgi:dUTP pyrophosphatase